MHVHFTILHMVFPLTERDGQGERIPGPRRFTSDMVIYFSLIRKSPGYLARRCI